MKIFITMLMVLMTVPVFAKVDKNAKDLTPSSVKNWYVSAYHTKDYDEMTDEVFEESDLTSVLQSFKSGYAECVFALGCRSWGNNGNFNYAEEVLLSIGESFQPNDNSILVRFDSRPAEKFNVTVISNKDNSMVTNMKIGDGVNDFIRFVDLCKKSSKLLIRVEAGECSQTMAVDLTNFTKVYEIYAKNRPIKK